MKNKMPCSKCGAQLQPYWLKDGVCNACRNPHLVVTAQVTPHKPVSMQLWSIQSLIGHCQLTYSSKNDQGQTLVYCLQDNGEKHGGIKLLRCTQDGEPEYEVSFTKVRADFERPTVGSSDSEYAAKLKTLCNAWIDNYERTA